MGFLWALEAGFLSAFWFASAIAMCYAFLCIVVRFFQWADNLNYAKGKWGQQ